MSGQLPSLAKPMVKPDPIGRIGIGGLPWGVLLLLWPNGRHPAGR